MTKCQSSWDQKPINLSIWRITPTKTIFYPTKFTRTHRRTLTLLYFHVDAIFVYMAQQKVVKDRLYKTKKLSLNLLYKEKHDFTQQTAHDSTLKSIQILIYWRGNLYGRRKKMNGIFYFLKFLWRSFIHFLYTFSLKSSQ